MSTEQNETLKHERYTTENPHPVTILPYDTKNEDCSQNQAILQQCCQFLKKGGLVSFPTETVYGLGAHALDKDAVYSIFKAKNRPLTDPVIVHVSNVQQALSLIDFTTKNAESKQKEILELVYTELAKRFWPGPLTIVANSNKNLIPDCVTASTGFVGIRIPKHPVALKLIETSNLPIAAPSANRFGHVSPTCAQHVYEDLSCCGYGILILDVGTECCQIGIESTVAKLDMMEEDLETILLSLTVLRRGGVSVEQIEKAIKEIVALQHQSPKSKKFNIALQLPVRNVKNNTKKGQEAPGQMITHYAPDVPAFLCISSMGQTISKSDNPTTYPLSDVVVVDFGAKLSWTQSQALSYLDLSKHGDINQAANSLFNTLRISEKVVNAKAILLPDMKPYFTDSNKMENADALYDRLYRAASGRNALLDSKDNLIQILEDCE